MQKIGTGNSGIIRFIKFEIVGGSGVIVNAVLLRILTRFAGLNYKFSSIAAIETAIISNFFLNYFWTWKDRRENSKIQFLQSFWKFNFSCGLVAFIVNWGLLVFLTEIVHLYYEYSNLIGIAFGTIANFFISHFWTFSPILSQRE